jgi:fatty-acyl-CoA synthase
MLVLSSPDTFVLSPASWMELVSRYRGTVTGGPSFSYALAARALGSRAEGDLSSLRVAFNGGEPVSVEVVRRFAAAGAAGGLAPGALRAVYGMAEATLMATCPGAGTPAADLVDVRALREDGCAVAPRDGADGRRLAILGPPVPGMSLRIVDPGGTALDDRRLGEIELRGPSVTSGYLGRDDLTAAAFRDGWLRTGDRGYVADGSLVVCGRWRDLVIVGGRNIEPDEIEQAVERVEGVRAGNVVAFTVGEAGDPARLVIVAETRTGDARLSQEVGRAVRSSVGVWPDHVVLVPPTTLPKTSSGKLQRSACRALFLGGELERIT